MTNTTDMDELLNKIELLTRTLHDGNRVKSYFITDDFKICYLQGREILLFLKREVRYEHSYFDPKPSFTIKKVEDILHDLPRELRKLVLFNISMFR